MVCTGVEGVLRTNGSNEARRKRGTAMRTTVYG
jgi:hypothetical protein